MLKSIDRQIHPRNALEESVIQAVDEAGVYVGECNGRVSEHDTRRTIQVRRYGLYHPCTEAHC